MKKGSLVSILGLLAFLGTSPPVSADADLGQVLRLKRVAKKLTQKALDNNAEKLWRHDFEQPKEYGLPHPSVYGNTLEPYFPDVLQQEILGYLSSSSDRCASAPQHAFRPSVTKAMKKGFHDYQLEQVNQFLGQIEFIPLPEVTAQEARELQQALQARDPNETTSIRAEANANNYDVVIPTFKGANVKNSIGLYKAVMGTYPDLTKATWMNDARRAATYAAWRANPDLPLTHTTSAMDVAFADRLSQLTGRKFKIMSDPQNEYMRRGRVDDTAETSGGAITATKYHFGDNGAELKNRAFIDGNPLTQNRAHGVHEIPAGAQAGSYKNARGFIHPIGNVDERSADGVLRGSAFRSGWSAKSSVRFEGFADDRKDGIGSRLAEVP